MRNKKPFTNQRKKRPLQLKTYYILTDAEQTEKNYFEGLKLLLPSEMRDKMNLRIIPKVKRSKLIEEAQKLIALSSEYQEAWLVFDKDDFKDFDQLIKAANDAGLKTGWSNPCFEIWLLAYFGEMGTFQSAKSCTTAFGKAFFKKSGRQYVKADPGIYQTLLRYGDENVAIDIAHRRYCESCQNYTRLSDMMSTSHVYELVMGIKRVVDSNSSSV